MLPYTTLFRSGARTATPEVAEVGVVGLVDPVPATLTAVQQDLGLPESAAFASLTEALAGVEADAVVITAPAVTHVPLAPAAPAAGQPVLVAKPFAHPPAARYPHRFPVG